MFNQNDEMLSSKYGWSRVAPFGSAAPGLSDYLQL